MYRSEYAREASTAQLGAKRLHQIWESLEEEERVAFLGSLSDDASNELLTFQMRQKEREQAKAEARSRRATAAARLRPEPEPEPAPTAQGWPTDISMDQWTNEELHAYLAAADAEQAAAPAPAREVGEEI